MHIVDVQYTHCQQYQGLAGELGLGGLGIGLDQGWITAERAKGWITARARARVGAEGITCGSICKNGAVDSIQHTFHHRMSSVVEHCTLGSRLIKYVIKCKPQVLVLLRKERPQATPTKESAHTYRNK